jgi:CRP-like cAMP-binding protein
MSRKPPPSDLVQFQAGEIVFRQGDPGESMFLIVSGTVRVLKELAGVQREINLLETGDFFGEISILQGDSRSATVQAATDVKLMRIDRQGFENLLKLDVEIPIRMMRRQVRTLQMAERRLEKVLGLLSDRERLELEEATDELTGARSMGPQVAELTRSDGTERWGVYAKVTRLGREDKVTGIVPEVDLSTTPEKNSVSRYHARLLADPDGFRLVEEAGVKNGTFVNGQRLKPGQPLLLKSGDRVRLGEVELRFEQTRG